MAKIAFTATRVQGFRCPPDKQQAFLWDAVQTGLGLRATPNGEPAYIFQSVIGGKTVRITIGAPSAWSIPDAQAKARELQRLIDEGKDPRLLKRNAIAEAEAQRQREAQQAQADALAQTPAHAVWTEYLQDRQPFWGERHHTDHVKMAKAGGQAALSGIKRRDGQATAPGPLYALLQGRLSDMDADTIEAWANTEGKTRPTTARLALRLLKAFLGWCAEHPRYATLVPSAAPAKTKKTRELLGKATSKDDALLKEQLPAWFAAVGRMRNTTVSAYLQTLLLTGARPGEVLGLKWVDVDTQWRGLTIRDKVEGERIIPLTPYVWNLIAALPRRNEYVFATSDRTSATGHIARPTKPHTTACKVAGVDGLTLHGLRRSFKSLTEWLEVPAGVVAQIMGHKPSATAEKHYTVRPLDLLRVHHEKIEAWMLEQAGVSFNPNTQPAALRLVA